MAIFEFRSTKKVVDEDLSTAIDTIVGPGTLIKGEIITSKAIKIEGDVEGGVDSQSDIFIGEKSFIKGNVCGNHVIVSGKIQGNAVARKVLEITANGKVYGDVSSEKLIIDEGAFFKGKVDMEEVRKQEIQ